MACETNLSPVQGDQIGRSFASWARVYFRIVFCKITEVALIFGTTVFRGNGYVLIMTQKMGWARYIFRHLFSQNHPVTLIAPAAGNLVKISTLR
jgi:hypothetical protein